jgi:hypothetical protein
LPVAHDARAPTCSPIAVRGRCGADITAGAAVVGVVSQRGADPEALDRAGGAPVRALPVHARALLIGTGLGTADVAPADAAEAVRVVAASTTGGETGVLL